MEPQRTTPIVTEEKAAWRQEQQRTFGKALGVAGQLATMKAKYITSEWYSFYQVYVHESETAPPIPLLMTTSGAPVETAEGAEMLGITADKLVMACRRGSLSRGRGVRKTEIREVAVVSHNLQQRRAAEAEDVKFAVEQHMGAAVMLL